MDPRPSSVDDLKPALPQAGSTASRRGWSAELALVILFLALVASGLLIQTAVELRTGQGVGALELFREKPTAANLRAYEHSLEDASVVAGALRPWFQFAQFAWLGDGGEKAVVGRDGWLFYKPGFDAMVSRQIRPASTNDPAAAIVAWRDALARRGIQLLVVLAPNKESIYPDYLTRRAAPGQILVSPSTRDLLARLQSAQVECVDLFKVFAQARANPGPVGAPHLYLAQDSHWSPAGVALAAQAVGRRLIEKGWVSSGQTRYREKPVSVERLGDVLRMLQSPPIEKCWVHEKVPCVQVICDQAGQPFEDQADSGVLVLGDSFLRIYQQDEPGSAGFIAHLAKELKQPLASLVSDGGASTLVRQELYRRGGLLKNKRVVVWEFVERDIHLGTEGWQPVPLPEQPPNHARRDHQIPAGDPANFAAVDGSISTGVSGE